MFPGCAILHAGDFRPPGLVRLGDFQSLSPVSTLGTKTIRNNPAHKASKDDTRLKTSCFMRRLSGSWPHFKRCSSSWAVFNGLLNIIPPPKKNTAVTPMCKLLFFCTETILQNLTCGHCVSLNRKDVSVPGEHFLSVFCPTSPEVFLCRRGRGRGDAAQPPPSSSPSRAQSRPRRCNVPWLL